MKNIIILIISFILTENAISQEDIIKYQSVIAKDRSESQEFGYALDISGEYSVISARLDTNDRRREHPNHASGAAYIFKYDSTENKWNETQKLVASDRKAFAIFGSSVSMNEEYIVIGAPQEYMDHNNSDSLYNAGAAYLFRYDKFKDEWLETQKLIAGDREKDDNYGNKVLVDKEFIFIGAWNEGSSKENKNAQSGAVYIYKYNELKGQYVETQKLVASDRKSNAIFGTEIARSGKYLIIGAPYDGLDEVGNEHLFKAGAAYVFKYDENLDKWIEIQKIVANNQQRIGNFGRAIAVDGQYAAISHHTDYTDSNDKDSIFLSGAVYIYKIDEASGQFEYYQKVVASDRARADYFSLPLVIDGDELLIGANNKDFISEDSKITKYAGAVYYFILDKETEKWNEQKKIIINNVEKDDGLGRSIAKDGNNLLFGTYTEDDKLGKIDSVFWAGSAHFYKIDTSKTSVKNDIETNNRSQITIFPNPNNGKAKISIAVCGNFEAYIVNTRGERVITIANGDIPIKFTYELEDTNLLSGTYFVIIENEAGVLSKKMFVVK